MCVTQSEAFRYDRSLTTAFFGDRMEVGDDGAAGPSWLGYYEHQTASPTTNVTRATCASPAPTYYARA